MTGIKESSEVVTALKVLVTEVKVIQQNGANIIADLQAIKPLFQALKDAKEGSADIAAELKDLDADEVQELLSEVIDLGILAYQSFFVKSE